LAQKIGVLGGTFNPIHYGHLAAAEEIRDRLKLDRVLFIPVYLPPHKQEEGMLSAVQRLEMVRLATAGNPHFKISDIEVKREGMSYTIDTIEALRAANPGAEFYFITGLDSFLEIQTWKDWEKLLSLCCFVVLSRPGYKFKDLLKIGFMKQAKKEIDTLDRGVETHVLIEGDGIRVCLELVPFYDISSTDIRKRTHEARTIKYHLPETVENYIIENKLYA
jgi:nicotinate-nucleotide adenylyltransferase